MRVLVTHFCLLVLSTPPETLPFPLRAGQCRWDITSQAQKCTSLGLGSLPRPAQHPRVHVPSPRDMRPGRPLQRCTHTPHPSLLRSTDSCFSQSKPRSWRDGRSGAFTRQWPAGCHSIKWLTPVLPGASPTSPTCNPACSPKLRLLPDTCCMVTVCIGGFLVGKGCQAPPAPAPASDPLTPSQLKPFTGPADRHPVPHTRELSRHPGPSASQPPITQPQGEPPAYLPRYFLAQLVTRVSFNPHNHTEDRSCHHPVSRCEN